MRLFHVSEESDIEVFIPRVPDQSVLKVNYGLVWAIDEKCLANYLTPRNCPRVTYHIGEKTSPADKAKYFATTNLSHRVIIEDNWLEILRKTTLYIYEFDPKDFELHDKIAGYYVAKTTQYPINKFIVNNIEEKLKQANAQLVTVKNLWPLCDEIKTTTLNWSFCRMAFAKPREK